MFGPLGVPELIFILVLALLIFGPRRLPEIGRTLGKGMSEFRKASNDLKRTINTELALEESPAPPTLPPAARQLPALDPLHQRDQAPAPAETAADPALEPAPPAFRMPQGPPPEVEARSSGARPLPPEWTAPPEPEAASTGDASTGAEPSAQPLEPR